MAGRACAHGNAQPTPQLGHAERRTEERGGTQDPHCNKQLLYDDCVKMTCMSMHDTRHDTRQNAHTSRKATHTSSRLSPEVLHVGCESMLCGRYVHDSRQLLQKSCVRRATTFEGKHEGWAWGESHTDRQAPRLRNTIWMNLLRCYKLRSGAARPNTSKLASRCPTTCSALCSPNART